VTAGVVLVDVDVDVDVEFLSASNNHGMPMAHSSRSLGKRLEGMDVLGDGKTCVQKLRGRVSFGGEGRGGEWAKSVRREGQNSVMIC